MREVGKGIGQVRHGRPAAQIALALARTHLRGAGASSRSRRGTCLAAPPRGSPSTLRSPMLCSRTTLPRSPPEKPTWLSLTTIDRRTHRAAPSAGRGVRARPVLCSKSPTSRQRKRLSPSVTKEVYSLMYKVRSEGEKKLLVRTLVRTDERALKTKAPSAPHFISHNSKEK